MTAVGRFADMWGRKLLYVYGFVIFTIASVLCGLAPDFAALCVFRALQAVGAAMLQANSLAIIVLVVEERSLGKAIGLQGAAQALGLAVGPTVGGLLLAAGGWRLIFFVNVPFGVFGAVAAILLVPRSRNLLARVAFDWTGLAIFFPAVVALLSAISFGAALGWSSATIVALFIAAAVLLAVFVWHERIDKDPMLDLGLFRSGQFSTGIVSGVLSYLVMFGVLLLVPFYFERGLDLGTARSGLELMAMPLAFGIVAPLAGRFADKVGARPLTVLGMTLVTVALSVMAATRPTTVPFLLLLAAVGVGMGLFTSPNNASIMGAAPEQNAGMASGVLNMSRGWVPLLGLALTGSIFTVAGGDTGSMEQAAHVFSVTRVRAGPHRRRSRCGLGPTAERHPGPGELGLGGVVGDRGPRQTRSSGTRSLDRPFSPTMATNVVDSIPETLRALLKQFERSPVDLASVARMAAKGLGLNLDAWHRLRAVVDGAIVQLQGEVNRRELFGEDGAPRSRELAGCPLRRVERHRQDL